MYACRLRHAESVSECFKQGLLREVQCCPGVHAQLWVLRVVVSLLLYQSVRGRLVICVNSSTTAGRVFEVYPVCPCARDVVYCCHGSVFSP